MVYHKLFGKQIGLVGTQKICTDLQEFLGELNFGKIIFSDDISLNLLNAFENFDYIFIGARKEDLDEAILKKCQTVAFTLEDIYIMVDETETFYIDKQHSDRTICAYGSRKKLTEMIIRNPNLKMDYVVLDEDIKDEFQLKTIELDNIQQLQRPFVIIADDACSRV